ncbi:MAG TPA: hypothetical protein VF814_20155 [Casimicrobiaceae bacterium]
MLRLFRPLFFGLAAAIDGAILATSRTLPERVASHFASGGAANGSMPREAYVALVLAMATLLPLFIVAMMARLPRVHPRRIRLPHRDYWLAPERRYSTFATLSGFAWALACALTLFVGGMYWLILVANATNPPQLAESAGDGLALGFGTVVVLWAFALYLRFRRLG